MSRAQELTEMQNFRPSTADIDDAVRLRLTARASDLSKEIWRRELEKE